MTCRRAYTSLQTHAGTVLLYLPLLRLGSLGSQGYKVAQRYEGEVKLMLQEQHGIFKAALFILSMPI